MKKALLLLLVVGSPAPHVLAQTAPLLTIEQLIARVDPKNPAYINGNAQQEMNALPHKRNQVNEWRLTGVAQNAMAMIQAVIPSSRGGEAARPRKCCEATFESADGVVRNIFDHPVRAYQRMPSAISIDGASTPPWEGGDYNHFQRESRISGDL